MKIGILGSGNMGRALGARWAQAGHEVFFGGRDSEKTRQVAEFVGHSSQAGSLQQAAAFGDVLLHTARDAMPSTMVDDVSVFQGKTLIDLNNGPIPEGFAYQPVTESFAERFKADVPGLRVVKAFNLFAMEFLANPPETIREHGVSLFYAGDDADAKASVAQLASDLGFVSVDSGPLRNARLLESMGDMIRYLLIAEDHSGFTTFSLASLPKADTDAIGARQQSNFG